jgi:hypothetical protein
MLSQAIKVPEICLLEISNKAKEAEAEIVLIMPKRKDDIL